MARIVVFGATDDTWKWVACANAIAERIADQRYPPGRWLPPLEKISADVGIQTADATLKRALAEVCSAGLISLADEVGYYVGAAEPPGKPTAKLRHLRKRRPRRQDGIRQQDDFRSPLLDKHFITVKEFATFFRVSVISVYRLIQSGEIEGSIKVGRAAYRVPSEAVQSHMRKFATGEQQSGPEQPDGDDIDTSVKGRQ